MKYFGWALVGLIASVLVLKWGLGSTDGPKVTVAPEKITVLGVADEQEHDFVDLVGDGGVFVYYDLSNRSFCYCGYMETINQVKDMYDHLNVAMVFTGGPLETVRKMAAEEKQGPFPGTVYWDRAGLIRDQYHLTKESTVLFLDQGGKLVTLLPNELGKDSKISIKILHMAMEKL